MPRFIQLGLILCLWTIPCGGAEPPPRSRADVERSLSIAREASHEQASLRDLRILLVADQKDHGPGEHDYPRWQSRWSLLLGGSSASDEPAANLFGPDRIDAESPRGAPQVRVERATGWPSAAQWESCDLVVVFCYLNWNPDRIEQVRRYLNRGKGLVLIHSATWTKPRPSEDVAGVAGVGGFQKWRHGRLGLKITAADHPICLGLSRQLELDDESYWPPSPSPANRIQAIAECAEEMEAGQPPLMQPMFWTYEPQSGRVFGCVPGHCSWTFDDPYFRLLLLRGMAWAAGESPYRFDQLAVRSASVTDESKR